ncbi:hypothetical protein [Echinicola arenosa]|nr:hypothetical protein [Echinicola arenosa]
MNRKSRQKNLLHQRMTVLLVALCCFLISNSHSFINLQDDDCDLTEQVQDHDDDQDQDHQTFLDVATDAVVVPFASLVAENTMQLIYEIVGFEEQIVRPQASMAKYPSHFLEVLLERIMAPNAP